MIFSISGFNKQIKQAEHGHTNTNNLGPFENDVTEPPPPPPQKKKKLPCYSLSLMCISLSRIYFKAPPPCQQLKGDKVFPDKAFVRVYSGLNFMCVYYTLLSHTRLPLSNSQMKKYN